ncbi:MAG TPA: hypothetical protein VFJ77_09445 [Gaiellaceae bacterium]|nr:hypothetical protein [Gaiellaceae bacterium]
MRRALAAVALAAALAAAVAACGSGTTRPDLPNASAARGKQLIEYYGCGACHVIGGIAAANGRVGPSLRGFSGKREIAGVLPNTAGNVVRWIMNPQQISPRTDMPDLGVGERGARSIAAYLYGQ